MLDHLISTESMETIHDSSELTRTEKTAFISNWNATHSMLRVCFNRTGFQEDTASITNCGRCEKCIRTMKMLEIFGKLGNYSTFPRKPGHHNVWLCNYASKGARIYAGEIISGAWKAGKPEICIDFCIAIVLSLVLTLPRKLARHTHLLLEERSEYYAVQIRRLVPRLRRRAYRIR